MTLSFAETLAALPRELWIPIVVLVLVAVGAAVARLALFRPGRVSLVSQFTARAGVAVTATLACMGAIGIANTTRAGLEGLLPGAERLATQVRPEAERAWRDPIARDATMAAALAGAVGIDPRIRVLVAGPFPCRDACTPVAFGPGTAANHAALLAHFATRDPGRTVGVARVGGETLVMGRSPLRNANGDPNGILVIGIEATGVIARSSQVAWAVLLASLVVAVLAITGFASAVRRFFSERLDTLLAMLDPTPATSPDATRDEFTRLSTKVNALVGHAVALETQLQEARRAETVGRLAGGVAHEFNNLMTSVIGHAQMAAFTLPVDAPERSDLVAIQESAARAASLTAKLLQFTGKHFERRRPVDLAAVLERARPAIQDTMGPGTRVDIDATPGLVVVADESHISQVLLELADNARQAAPPARSLIITAVPLHQHTPSDGVGSVLPPGDYACLTVHDTGGGIPADALPRIFDPFYSTRPMHAAAGLGLAAVLGIVHAHQGTVEVESTREAGTTFRFLLPLAPADTAAVAPTGER